MVCLPFWQLLFFCLRKLFPSSLQFSGFWGSTKKKKVTKKYALEITLYILSGCCLKYAIVFFQALLESQEKLAAKIPNFHFNLGFSGFYFKNGSPEENSGDEMLIEHAQKFWWFPHMYRHQKPHKFESYESLVKSMMKNKRFAEVSLKTRATVREWYDQGSDLRPLALYAIALAKLSGHRLWRYCGVMV